MSTHATMTLREREDLVKLVRQPARRARKED